MKVYKPKFWNKKNSIMGFFLLPISFIFQILIALQRKFTKKKHATIPVICVGNIYLGGTGKTPLSLRVANILKKLNKKVAIIKKLYEEHDDEFKLIESSQVDLFKNSSRYKAISEAANNNYDCVVLDDGFQDFSIACDLNILCFNEKQLIGNGMTLPSGPLREPLSSLKRCHIVVINGDKNFEFEKKIKKISNGIDVFYSKYLPVNTNDFKNKNLLAFAGIGNPDNFFSLLEENKLNIKKKISFPDHYNYTLKELNELIGFSLKNNLKLVTTEKDFYRIKHYNLKQIEFLNIKLEILNEDRLLKKIIKYL